MTKHVYISLVNWLNWQDTLNVVLQLTSFNYTDLRISISVVDNASPNDSFDQLKKRLPGSVSLLLAASNEGYAAGHELNLKRAFNMNVDFFWILNSDIIVNYNTLISFIVAYNNHGEQLYGSITLNEDNTIDFAGVDADKKITEDNLEFNSAKLWKSKQYALLLNEAPDIRKVHNLEGSSFFIPIKLVVSHGFMKTDFFMYGEESDYCIRLKKKGVHVSVVTQSVIYHHKEGSAKDYKELRLIVAYYRRRNFLRLSIDHYDMSRWKALSFNSGAINNIKTVLKGFLGFKTESYYYALGSLHASLGIKGKTVSPEKIIRKLQ